MRMFSAFLKKELTESVRTYRLFILLVLFLLLGFMSPVTAKVLPELMDSLMPTGMAITLPPPTALDSWAQFFKNTSQMGLIIVVIVFGGIMAGEFSRGTLINMLTKGLSRPVVVLSKFTAGGLIWSAAYALCFGVTYVYTEYLWSADNVHHLPLSVAGPWVFGLLLIACLILGGILFRNNIGSLLFTFGIVVAAMLVGIAPKLQKFDPISLVTQNNALVAGQLQPEDFYPALIIAGGLTLLFLLLSVLIFNKKQL